VALLEVPADAGTVAIGNPLHGAQVMRIEALDGYWIGEAILAEARAQG
jgi:hypothetical protein